MPQLVRARERDIKAQLRHFKENEQLRAWLRFACGAVVVLLPFYLLVRANAAWTPHPRFFPDDAVYARMCFPTGFLVYWNDFGFYRLLAVPAYALSNRAVMRASLSPVPFTLLASAFASVVFVCACVSVGLSRRRGVLLAGVLLSSPLLLETLNFWSGTFNYALVLLLVSAQLRACVWARRVWGEASEASGGVAVEPSKGFAGGASKGLIVTACGALLALLTYEIALPFILATSALYVRGWLRRLLTIGVAAFVVVAFVLALAASGLYWPQRFKLAAKQLTSAISRTATVNANISADANASANENATDDAGVETNSEQTPVPATTPALPASERARMYVALLFSFIRTGLRSTWFWALALALAGASFLSRAPESEPAAEGRLPESVLASAFALALVACVGYLALTKSMNARYAAFLLIYGAATLAWTRGRVARYALASLLLLQVAVAASLPVHMRDVELAAKGAASVSTVSSTSSASTVSTVSTAARASDLVSVNGRLARASWGKRFLAPPPVDMLTQPLGPRACRYAVPCEECK